MRKSLRVCLRKRGRALFVRGSGFPRHASPPFLLFALPLLLSACSDSRKEAEPLPESSKAGSARQDAGEGRLESRLSRAVTIGEDGQRLDACGGYGVVQRVAAGGALDVRAAPFAGAKAVAALANGRHVFICTRSLDQQWLGVVIVPESEKNSAIAPVDNAATASPPPAPDCGVSSPVESRRPYDGPCQSGWVSSTFIQLVAG